MRRLSYHPRLPGARDCSISIYDGITSRRFPKLSVQLQELEYSTLTNGQVFQLTALQTLDVSRNRISVIPDGIKTMTSLKFLAFTNNQVTRLPLCFGDMPSLTKLKFDDNPVEFPRREEYLPDAATLGKPGVDSNTYICTQVKRYLRQATIRERQRAEAEAEVSESNLETPRPPRRTITGRFPVRPSVSGIDTSEFNTKGDGSFSMALPPPPIPSKSRARDSIVFRRPGLAPLSADGINSRSRSETVASAPARSKRLGFVPRKTSGPPGSANTISDNQTLKPAHYRGASFSSALGPSSGGETSSGPVSPVDGPAYRPWAAKSRLSSLPEDRRISKITSPTIRTARLLIFSLYHLQRPIEDVIRMIKGDAPGQTHIERLCTTATVSVAELDRQLHILTPMGEQDNHHQETTAHVRALLKRSRNCAQAHGHLVMEMQRYTRKVANHGDSLYLRAILMQIFSTLVELRNACNVQEAVLRNPPRASSRMTSGPVSDRTVTPTQSRPVTGKRMKGMKILAGLKSKSPGSVPSSAALTPHHLGRKVVGPGNGSATPRSGDNFHHHMVSHNNTMKQQPVDSEEERQFEKIYLNLQHVCALADQILPNCRLDFYARREGAARSMQATAARAWTLALNRCDSVLNALDQLKRRLAKITLKDPALRNSRDFWHLCDVFVRVSPHPLSLPACIKRLRRLLTCHQQSWFDLGSEMKNLGNQGLDIGAIKVMMRPVQKAVKEVGHFIDHSPVYKGALRGQPVMPPPMPPTPLSAALGPAAQATIPSTPSVISPAEYMYPYNYGKERERSDTVGSRYGRR